MLDGIRVLLVEPDEDEARRLAQGLVEARARVARARDGADAFVRLHEGSPGALGAAVVAERLPDVAGADVLRWVAALRPAPAGVLLCERAGWSRAREAMHCGAVHVAARGAALVEELVERLAEAAGAGAAGAAGEFAGSSAAAHAVRARIAAFAGAEAPVLVRGETGTGKELVARALHTAGPRREGPFVPVNCAALPAELLEGELFGAVRGAYTGADRDRTGLVEAAAGGTLFLDEVGELPLPAQAKLLRALDAGRIRPLGATRERSVPVRVVAATHRDLDVRVREGAFREDLLFRLDVLRIEIPPLRERPADIPVLARRFAARLGPGGTPLRLAPEAVRDLLAWHWPGNARELAAALGRAAARSGEVVRRVETPARGSPAGEGLEALLRRHRGALPALARELGVSVRTVQRRLARAGLRAADFRAAAARPEGPLSAAGR